MAPKRNRRETHQFNPVIAGEKWIMQVHVMFEGEMVQNETKLDPLNPKLLDMMRENGSSPPSIRYRNK